MKCIIFDFGGVIGDFNHMKSCQRLAEFSVFAAEKIYELIFKSGLEKRYDEGLPWNEFLVEVKRVTRATGLTSKTFQEIWGDIFSPNPGIDEVLESVNKKMKILLLSNTNEMHWRYIARLPAIKKYFSNPEQLILSFKVGVRKPDQKIFLEGIKRSGYQPNEILYVDDIAEYVDAFRKLGGNGIVYDCRVDTPEKLQNEMKKYF